jgi:subtilisin family serine protease
MKNSIMKKRNILMIATLLLLTATGVKAGEKKRTLTHEARKYTNVDKVNTAEEAQAQLLPQAYTGKGVVLGVIDSGIDYNHAAFRNPTDGKLRIVKVIDFSQKNKRVFSTEQEIMALTADKNDSHGTMTSSIAGGSDLGNGLQGMAPEADLILCGMGDYIGGENVNECIKEIFDYATSVGKPAVINISLGDDLGLHDGSDVTAIATAIQTENGSKPGRAIIYATGNSASNWQSITRKFNSTSEELKTVLGSNTFPLVEEPTKPVTYDAYYSAYADDYQDFMIELKVVDTTNGTFCDWAEHVRDAKTGAVIPVIDLKKTAREIIKNLDGKDAVYYNWGLKNYKMDDPKYRLALVVKAGNAGQTVKLMCDADENGEPCFDAPNWNNYDFANAGYTKGNGDFNFGTDFCVDAAISVGAYVTRTDWTSYDGSSQSYSESKLTGKKQEIGEIADFSSYGIDDNGLAHPTVLAPGKGIIAAANNYDYDDYFISGQPGVINKDKDLTTLCPEVTKFGRTNWYALSEGTSLASPMVAGIVAVWMQANPNLTVNEIKQIMKETSINDEWTTNINKIPSHNKTQVGYGKIDCLAGLKKILNNTDIDVVTNDKHRHATPATMYSIDAPVYNMQGQQVDKSYKGLVIYKGHKYVNR